MLISSLACIVSSAIPSATNGNPNYQEYLKIYNIYKEAEENTYEKEEIHTNIPLMITVDLYISENNFSKIDFNSIQQKSDSMVVSAGDIIHEDIDMNGEITGEIRELEDTNNNNILENNKKVEEKQLEPAYDYLKQQLEKSGQWNSFNSNYNHNIEEIYMIYQAQVYFIEQLKTSMGILEVPINEPYEITAGYNSSDEVHEGNHNGVDFAHTGDEVPIAKATEDGKVIMTNTDCPSPGSGLGDMCGEDPFNGGGNFIVIKHTVNGKTFYSLYAHLKEVLVEEGDEVKRGDKIGLVGSSGNSTGNHLHFSIFDEEFKFYDPEDYLDNGNSDVSEDKKNIMKEAGIKESDYSYVDYIVDHESSWDYTATNESSGAYGLCQALPPEKMESAGSDWKTNPVTQMKWCDSYATSRYGSWEKAYHFWKENNWW